MSRRYFTSGVPSEGNLALPDLIARGPWTGEAGELEAIKAWIDRLHEVVGILAERAPQEVQDDIAALYRWWPV